MKNWLTVWFSLFLGLALSPAFAEPPPYGRGFDVYTTSSGIALSGNTLLLTWPAGANQAERFLVSVDVSDPAQPALRDRLALEGFPQDLAIDGSRAYVVNGRDLLVVDIADPAVLRLIHSLRIDDDPLRGPQGIALAGNTAWLACRRGGIRAVDLTDPAAPRIAGALELPAFVRGVTVDGERLYAAADTLGVYSVDIATPAEPRLLHHTPAPAGCVGRIRLHDGYAYLAAGNILAATLSLADPARPQWLGATAERGVMSPFYGGYAHDLAVVEDTVAAHNGRRTLIVAADGESGLIVADMTRPDTPRFLGAVLGEGLGGAYIATGLAVAGNMVYLVDQSFGLRLVDITRPEAPIQVGEGLPF